MSLTGVLDVLLDERSGEPALRAAVEAARSGGRTDLDLTAPPGIRPFALAAAGRPGRPPGAGRHRDRARGRGAGHRAARPAASRTRSSSSRPGRRCRTSGCQPAQRHRRPPAGRAAPAGPPGRRRTPATARCRSWSRRCARVLQPMVARARRPRAGRGCTPATRSTSTTWSTRLAAAAYTRVDLVERRGEFAVRGGIIDVFPPTEEHPLRVEFWGDTVEEVRWFKVADQRSLEIAEHGLWAPPCRELLLTDEVRERAARAGRAAPRAWPTCSTSWPRASRSRAWSRSRRCSSTRWCCCSTSCRPARHVVVLRPRAGPHPGARPGRHQRGVPRGVLGQRGRRRAPTPIDLGAAAYRSLADVRGPRPRELGMPWWTISPFAADEATPTDERRPRVVGGARASRATAATRPGRWPTSRAGCGDGWRVVLLTEGHGPAQRMVEVLARRGHRRPAGRVARPTCPEPGVVHVATAPASTAASSAPSCSSRCSPRPTWSGQAGPTTRDMRRMPSRRRNAVDPLQLQAGDYVVHEQHGVGRYVEMVQRTVAGRHPRVPRDRVRPAQARPAGRPALRARPTSSTRSPGTSAARRRRCTGSAAPTGRRPRAAPARRSRRSPAELIRLYAARTSAPGLRVRPGHPVAARARGRLPLRRDARPARRHRRGQGRHGEAGPDGPADLRRRRLRQDRDRGAGRVQGGAGRQAGGGAGADHAAGPPAPVDVRRALRAASRSRSRPLSRFQTDKEANEVKAGLARRHRRRRHRHPPDPLGRGAVQGPRPGDRRRGAALRRRAQGAAQAPAHQRRRADDVGDADPAHAGDGGHRHPRDVDDPHAAGGAAPGAHLRRRRTTRSRSARRSGASCCATARSSSSTTGSSRSTGPRPGCAQLVPEARVADRARPDERARRSSRSWSTSGRSGSTCWSAPRSSRAAWTSPTPTR